MATKKDLSDQAVDAAKQLAPWSTTIPWWVVLIEGLVLGAIGLMAVFNTQGANVTLALALSAGLVVAGLVQIWGIFRETVPEKIDSAVAARAAIAVYAGLVVLIFYFLGEDALTGQPILTRIAGYGIFASASFIYGLLALVQVIRTDGSSRRQALVEFVLFGAVGLLGLWGLFTGGENIRTAVQIIGWIFIIGGIALIGLSIWRWQKGDEADEKIEAVTGSIDDAADKVTSLGRKADAATEEEVAQAKESAAKAKADAAKAIDEAKDEADL
jgi:uncharacterized membrane protein HdeD (DUF308 family)